LYRSLPDAKPMPALTGPSIGMLLKRHSGSDAVVVDFIKAGGLADQSGKVTVGDIIVAVNGVDVRSIPLPTICELMANRDHKAICIDTLRDGKPHQVILFRNQPSSRDVTGARLHLKCLFFIWDLLTPLSCCVRSFKLRLFRILSELVSVGARSFVELALIVARHPRRVREPQLFWAVVWDWAEG